MRIKFLGGTKAVTGACYLLDVNQIKILIDCGLFQGDLELERENFKPFSFNPQEINFVFLTHAHIDHSGRIPKLYKEGFRGEIFCTKPTKDLTKLMLFDSFRILKRKAKNLGYKFPYRESDILKSLRLFNAIDYKKNVSLAPEISFQFLDAGHILGSAIVELDIRQTKIVFSGDLGNPPAPLLCSPEFVSSTDYLILESTYGDRIHEKREQRREILEDIIEEIVKKRGTLIIPAFALERTQEILFELNHLIENYKIPKIPIFVDGELASKATKIYKKYSDYFNKKAYYLIKSGDDLFKFPGLKFTKTRAQSQKINRVRPPKVIIVSAGMSEGERILHHHLRYLSDPKNCILFVTHQVKGTLGRKILDGEKQVEIFGKKIPIRAQISKIFGYSAHADQEGLLKWVRKIKKPIKKIFIVHGEERALHTLALKIKDRLGIPAVVPDLGQEFEI